MEDVLVLTDQDIAGMQPAERRDLIARLARPLTDFVDDVGELREGRRLRLGVTAAAAVLLFPWMLYLGFALPGVHRVRNWDVLWIGFDAIELALLVVTFWLGRQRRLLGLLTAFATGVVLLCDAWFDILTSGPGSLWQAVVAAALVEIPLAILLMSGAVRALRTVSALLWFSEPGAHTWDVRLPALGRRGVPTTRAPDAGLE